MSSLMYKPTTEGMPSGSPSSQPGRRVVSPAFTPQFRRSLREHPVLAGVVTAVVTLLLLGYAMRMRPVYSAESLVYIEPLSNKVLSDATGNSFDSTRYESLLQQEMQTAQRMDIMQSAIAALPRATWSEYGATPAIAAQNLQNQLKVARVAMSYQVSISLKGSDPVKTAAIVNAVTAAFLQAGRKDQLTDADQRSQLLAEERQRIEQELAQTRAEQTQLSAQLGVANPTGEGSNPFDTQLDNVRSQLTTARTNHDLAAAQLAALSGPDANHASGLTAAANDAIANDAGLSSMRATINQRRATLSSQMAGLTPGNPVYKQDQDELADLDKTLDTMTQQMRDKAARSLQDKLRSELERTGDVAGRLNSEVARQTAQATSAAPRLQRASDLSAEVVRLQTRYASVDNALHSLQLETTGPGMVHLALAASVPTGPEPNRKRLLELAALPLGFLCGLSAAVFARRRDTHLYTAGDVDDILGFAPIAIVPSHEEVSDAVLQEYYLRLAAGVEGAYRSGGARTFLLTAVSAGTEIHGLVEALDQKLVQLGLGVVVADASTMLVANDAASERGNHGCDRRYEGLAPAALERLKADHDVVLLEAPPLLYSAQAEYVARCADVTVLVVESSVTTRQELTRSGALLQRLNATGVGAILHGLRLQHADEGFRRAVAEFDRRTPYGAPVRVMAPAASVEPEDVAESVDVQEPTPVVEPVHEVEPVHASEPVGLVSDARVEAPDIPEILPAHSQAEAVASEPEDAQQPGPVVETLKPVQEDASRFSSYSDPAPVEAVPMHKSWLQRLFGRDKEETFSILPDAVDDDQQEAEYEPAPRRELEAVGQADAFDRDADIPGPMPEVAAAVEREPYEPAMMEPVVQAAPPVQPMAEAVQMSEPAAPRAYVPPVVPVQAAEVLPKATAPVVREPVRATPLKPLSFAELSRLSQVQPEPTLADDQSEVVQEPAAVEPVMAAVPAEVIHEVPASEPAASTPEVVVEFLEEHPAQPVAIAPEVVTQAVPDLEHEPTPEPVPATIPAPIQVVESAPVEQLRAEDRELEEWVPAPLNRWDPIPPLRADGAWRSRQFKAVPAEDSVWAQEDPMRIPPTDRWGGDQTRYPAEVAAETPDIVLTRRWGLLSRFQQGESFPPETREESTAEQPGDRRG